MQSVVLTGDGFSTTPADNVVTLGATRCMRVAVTRISPSDPTTATQISCGVPADTVAGMRKASSSLALPCAARNNPLIEHVCRWAGQSV